MNSHSHVVIQNNLLDCFYISLPSLRKAVTEGNTGMDEEWWVPEEFMRYWKARRRLIRKCPNPMYVWSDGLG